MCQGRLQVARIGRLSPKRTGAGTSAVGDSRPGRGGGGALVTPLVALGYSFLFGLLHGILPDEHTWPITFSYAIGSASGRQGMKAGLYFSAAFTLQRALLAEVAYLALAPFLLLPTINGVVYIVVGIVMAVAGAVVLGRRLNLHLHPLAHHHDYPAEVDGHGDQGPVVPQPRWALAHGFIAGFGFEGFSLFVNTVAVTAMPSPWLGFLPGLLFGLGTMLVLAVLGAVLGVSLRWARSLSEQQIAYIGSQTGGRTLFFGGILFVAFGIGLLLGIESVLPVDSGTALIMLFIVAVAIPSLVISWREAMAIRGPGR